MIHKCHDMYLFQKITSSSYLTQLDIDISACEDIGKKKVYKVLFFGGVGVKKS